MSDPSKAVTLTVDGLDYAGWTSVEINASLECQARKFTIGITWKWPGQNLARPVQPGARCELRIGGELVITGWVDAAPISYDHEKVTASISGRSLTGDLCDCAAINRPGQWKGQSVQAIVAAIAGEYGVATTSEIEATASLADHTLQPGETAFASIDRLLTLYRVFSTDNAQGQLVLAKAGSAGRASDSLELGRNVLGATAAMDFTKVFSEYRVIGQRAGTDQAFGVASNEVNANASDPRVTRKRVKLIQQSGQLSDALAAGRANWERGTALGKALETTYQVQGWRQANGALWLPNTLVRVVDPLLGFDRDMLIAEVTYRLSENGTTCTLRVGPPDAYVQAPDAPKPAPKAPGKDAFGHLLPPDGAPS
ncbi:phage baseplate assembly protein [Pseudomonas sp. KNUC1026]|uniref:phage baseplate assembly protein n=1 Tax=Pseudomonas sp. KNUC1026 TaxID=2893890 RepID=UPI001F180F25|nr:contractile injection system protein, VgrG/Pvc8 family [Pseudomonas sp. KNUC1026]UFH49930.1 baseplate protein [Pseudomonas sp. KNUC1026]